MQDFRHKKANLFVFLCEILLFAQRCERIFEVERFHRFGVLEVLPKFWNMQDFRHKKANLFVFLCEILLFAQRCERIFEVERFHRFGVLEVLPIF